MLPPKSLRPPRYYVSIPGALRIDRREAKATAVNLSAEGLGLLVRERVPDVEHHGAPVVVRLRPAARELQFTAQVRWVDEFAHDASGERATALGLRILEGTVEARAWLADSVRTYRHSVVLVDDATAAARQLLLALGGDYRVHQCGSPQEALAALQANEVAVLLADLDLNGDDFVRRCWASRPCSHTKFILATGQRDHQGLRELVSSGEVYCALSKPFRIEEVVNTVARAVTAYDAARETERLREELVRANKRLRHENDLLKRRLDGFQRPGGLVGSSAALRAALAKAEQLSRSEIAVLIEGDTGTGKELVAHLMHSGSARASRPLVAVNCGGIPEQLLQSFLFGHRRGAFTGADRDFKGMFREADGGTLFLDEVGDMTPAVQASLLRVLQTGEVLPLGETKPVQVDVRLISATNRDLKSQVRKGEFREDLYFRLLAASLRLPALRERNGDVALLAQHFLALECAATGKTIAGFATGVLQTLERYPWPGNVRELEQEVKRLVAMAESGRPIPATLLSAPIALVDEARQAVPRLGAGASVLVQGGPLDEVIEDVQRQLVAQALDASGGVLSRAASMLAIERTRLSRMVRRLGLPGAGTPVGPMGPRGPR